MCLLISVYALCTIATMLAMIILGYFGFAFTHTQKLERYVHVLGGATIFICGVGMLWMGW
jgi:hypothetical protein